MAEPRKATTAKSSDGDKRKEHAEQVCSRIEEVVSEYDINGSDTSLPKVMGLLLANQKLLSKLLPKINKSHVTQRLVNELFLGSMQIEHEAKNVLQRYLLEKCTYTNDERKKLLFEKSACISSKTATQDQERYSVINYQRGRKTEKILTQGVEQAD